MTAQSERSLRGRAVQSVIEELRAAGAPFVYSSNLLSSGLTVVTEPRAADALGIAREILQPHGLVVREENGVWLVVRGDPPAVAESGGIQLRVQAAYAGTSIPRLTVQVDPPSGPTASGVDGDVQLEGLESGRHALLVRADGFLPERSAVNVEPGRVLELSVVLFESVPALDEVIVTASRYEVSDRT